jgi:hypothetical protein
VSGLSLRLFTPPGEEHLKRILGRHRLRLRGPHDARAEFRLAAAAQNLGELARLTAQSTAPSPA